MIRRPDGKHARRQHGRKREREQDGATNGEGVGLRHRRHDDARHAGQREQGNERHRDDQRRREHGRTNLARRRDDALEGGSTLAREVAKNAFHHDHRRIDHNAEVHGAKRNEVCGGPARHHAGEREHQRQRQIDGRDEGGARAAEKQPQHQRDENHADKQILHHGVRGQFHQIGAVIDRFDLHARR